MNPLSTLTLGTPAAVGWPPSAAAPAAAPAPAAGTGAGATSRDAQMADLGSTSSEVNALQSLAMQAPATAPITIPQTQNTQPPTANTSNELVDAMSGGSTDDT